MAVYSNPIKKHDQKCPIKDVQIDNSYDWKRKILAQLVHYKKAPYYYRVLEVLKELFEKDFETITEFDRDSLTKIAEYLEITTPIRLFREMNLEIESVKCADEWALNICKAIPGATEYWNPPGGRTFFNPQKYIDSKIDIKFEEVEITEYSQKGVDFEAGLSIIDVMMFNSAEEINRMLDRYKIYDGN